MTDVLVVNCSPTAKSLPLHAGRRLGIFERHGIALEVVATENSRAQRDGLAQGLFSIVHVAIDNAVAMHDVDRLDVIVLMGGDPGMNELFVQPHVHDVVGIRGGRLVVDAADTAFALQAYRILAEQGLKRGTDYEVAAVGRGALRLAAMQQDPANTAAILNLPYSLEARSIGLKSLGDATDFLGPYQAGSAFAMRDWATSHRDLVVRYVAGYLEALQWVLDPANGDLCAAILVEEIGATLQIATESVAILRKPGVGLDPVARIDAAGFRNTLKLRADFAGTETGNPEHYLDLSFWNEAVGRRAAAMASCAP